MKRLILMIVAISGLTIPSLAQSNLSAGLGFMGGSHGDPGLVLEIEYEKMFTEDFSLPLRLDVSMISHPVYNIISFDLHRGFRKYFNSGFFAEQALGMGVLAMSGKNGVSWYHDDYKHVIRFGERAAWGIMPSATLGLGYKLTSKNGTNNLIWIRPKIYWNLAFATLDTPGAQVQVGFTKNFK